MLNDEHINHYEGYRSKVAGFGYQVRRKYQTVNQLQLIYTRLITTLDG